MFRQIGRLGTHSKKTTKFFKKIPKKFHFEPGVPRRGGGGWGVADVWEKFPNNPVFFLRAYLCCFGKKHNIYIFDATVGPMGSSVVQL